jgi:asparagine synthase (glutamine-hydrolysing)
MCGIAGKFDFSGKIVPQSLVRAMCNTIVDRGPDAEGIYVGPYIGLGERRLSVVDLSATANPPLSNEDGTIWVVFNGEIYNFQALRLKLKDLGHAFRTNSDTEVIVHLYEQYGTDCVRHMRGMFAFALWDASKRVLFAARDRFGEKPFYYAKFPTAFIFGSAIRAVTADPSVSISPDFPAIDSYLTRQYVPSPVTAFSGIFKLPAGHHLVCRADGALEINRYWRSPVAEKFAASGEEIESELLRKLKECIHIRLISDVPLGVFLSGGVDSGVVAALTAMESTNPIKTFSIGFEESDFNELPFARLVAERFGTEHHELIVQPAIREIVPLLVKHYNEPFADSSAIPTYCVSKLARRDVTVALGGDGGDEAFGGYDHYCQTLRWADADFVPWPARKFLARVMEGALESLPCSNFMARASRACHMIGSWLPERYATQIAIVKNEEKRAGYTRYFRSLLNGNGHAIQVDDPAWNESMDSLEWMSRHDQSNYLPDCLMVKVDIASMANSLEVRSPLLDHELFEFAAKIPSFLKRDRTGGKVILKRAARNLLPAEVLGKRKTGFGVPLSKWLRTELSDMLKGTLLDDTSMKRSLLKPTFMKKIVEEHISGKRDWSTRLWAFLFLELWFREFVD